MISPMTASAQAAVDALAQYRLEKNLTFVDLSNEMRKQGWYVPARSLHLALTHRVIPVDRTQFRIQQFVEFLGLDDPTSKKNKRSRTAA
jgi:hypothetical protein